MNTRTFLGGFAAVASLLAFASAASAIPGAAGPDCRRVVARLDLTASPTNDCGSAIDLCATGVLRGTLRGHSEFTGTSFVPTLDTEATGVLVLTGDNVIHAVGGDLFTKDSIVLSTTGVGDFAEVDTIVGGTGIYTGASGFLTATGVFANGLGEGTLVGEICWD